MGVPMQTMVESYGTSVVWALLIGVPLLVVTGVALLILGPRWSRAGRWRPGENWDHGPVYFADQAIEPPSLTGEVKAATPSTAALELPADSSQVPQVGGARGEW